MKKRLYFVTAILVATAALSLSSCLKDPRYYTFANVGTLVELPLAAYDGLGNTIPEALPIQSTPQTIPVVVNVASPKPLSTALTVTLAVDQSALDAYNTANGLSGSSAYVLPPANSFTIPNFKVTIPANQRQAQLQIQVNSSNLDPSALYILPISITDGGGQKISNYKTVLLNIQAKNKYDGEYTVTGTMVDGAAATITGDYPDDVYLETKSANSVVYYSTTAGFGHLILSNGSTSLYGEFAPIFTFDPATNNVTSVTNLYGQPSPSRVRAAVIDPTGANTFTTGTPGTPGAILKVKYIMTQGGAPRTSFDEVFTYKGPRP